MWFKTSTNLYREILGNIKRKTNKNALSLLISFCYQIIKSLKDKQVVYMVAKLWIPWFELQHTVIKKTVNIYLLLGDNALFVLGFPVQAYLQGAPPLPRCLRHPRRYLQKIHECRAEIVRNRWYLFISVFVLWSLLSCLSLLDVT